MFFSVFAGFRDDGVSFLIFSLGFGNVLILPVFNSVSYFVFPNV